MTGPVVAVMWPRLGPYHVARLEAAAKFFERHGGKVVAIETARTDSTYQWDPIGRPCGFERVTLFPGGHYPNLAARSIRRALQEALHCLKPAAVAVCGLVLPESRAGIAWARQRGAGLVIMSEGGPFRRKPSRLKEAVKGRIVRLCDTALVGGSLERDSKRRQGIPPSRIFLGYDVVDNRFFEQRTAAARAESGSANPRPFGGKPYLLTVARFVPEKNLLAAMEAYKRYREMLGPSAWGWVLCGDGLLKGDILAKRAALGFEECLALPGFVQIDDLPTYYAFARAFWLPSVSEPWGLAVNEAMASGLPVLVSKRAGCAPDLVAEGVNGWTFDPTSVEEMTEVLVRMHRLSDEQRAEMARRSREIIFHWGPERFAQGLWEAVQAALPHARERKHGLRLSDRLVLRIGTYRPMKVGRHVGHFRHKIAFWNRA